MKNKNLLSFQKGNAKLSPDTLLFSIPAGKTCSIGADKCLSMPREKDGKRSIQDGPNCEFRCFAASQEVLFPSVYESRKKNLELLMESLKSDQGYFKTYELINDSLQKHLPKNGRVKKVRIHVSGDYFSSIYLKCWLAVARLNPNLKFYSYSKSLSLFGTNLSLPDNFYLTASVGGKLDHLIHKGYFKRYAIVVNNEDEAKALGMLHIGKPYPVDHDDSHCFIKDEPFALLVHGVQPKGSTASKAISERKKKKEFSGYSRGKKS